ncbi:alkyl hydroperoxide reductase AhpD [Microbacterium barkeri]|uniref:Alkyl hydroperoxide reductase AhpD n=1 Tax=Microbacterium barkeri TaxID=33917 RepID=A0A9W6LX91_9MICO|nr:carboxymuconolactone decarboxylase family protein [Microbacterium barkeri]MDI6944005.1 carboxymuconolactone decarboxylase family protein [Microbacterium barkeri]MDR6876382.1 AhpD family alkylhydroperoxidase [Microbacterium barkeri]GLJ62008.1 alkyl hydroperoxide reductase AhpD [Microbacterium barkeri]
MTDTALLTPADADTVVAHKARMPHPAFLLEGGLDALTGLNRVARSAGLPEPLLHLLCLRASQINSCSWCAVDHAREMSEDGASPERIHSVAAWRDAPYFTERERVALEFTEAITRLADHHDPISDELWSRMTELFDPRQISALLFEIGAINVWNRINAAIRQPPGRR